MDLNEFRALLTSVGQSALQAASDLEPREADYLRHFTALSRQYPPGLARAALETAILRLEAVVKFPQASAMFFTREALEQASGQLIAGYRAQRYARLELIIDLGCSIGGDSLALVTAAPVLGVDLDLLRLHIAAANLAACGLGERAAFLRADLAAPLPFAASPQHGVFFDPARRSGGRRIYSVQDYHPPLQVIEGWLRNYPALGVKISPGVDLDEVKHYPAEIEFISVAGELKEAVLWFGPLRSAWRSATLLPGGQRMVAEIPLAELPPRISAPLNYIYEPDPAILRAGLVRQLGEQLGAGQLDPQIAYLTSESLVPTSFARAWLVETWFPFGLKRLRRELQARGVGQVVIKKRGSPLEPGKLERELRLSGDASRVVFLTQLRGEPVVILANPETKAGDPGQSPHAISPDPLR